MSEGQNLHQQMQQQATQSTQDFYGQSVGSLKSQVQNYREQLEQYAEQFPEGDAQAQVQEMIDSYTELENSMDLGGPGPRTPPGAGRRGSAWTSPGSKAPGPGGSLPSTT